jgi:D-glycero-alpha-D-manno-heptose-7-phosphate kinase
MIIVRAPLRLPIGGGGTDLPSYYSLYEGEWVSAAINKYIYIAINKRFQDTFRISYSQTEEVDDVEKIEHPIVRESLKLLGIKGGIEIVSIADIPSNTGLGTSGSFTVALLTALHAFLRNTSNADMPTRKEIAEQACHINMNILKQPCGKQDEYIGAYGGITGFCANKDGCVGVESLYPVKISPEILQELDNNLLMFYTGIRRESSKALQVQTDATKDGNQDMIDNLHRVKKIGQDIKEALAQKDFYRFGELMDQHWQEKIKRKGTSDPKINHWYDLAKESGAVGGKLVGAGGGGFFVFYCENNKNRLREAMAKEGLKEEPFRFDLEGVKVIADFI